MSSSPEGRLLVPASLVIPSATEGTIYLSPVAVSLSAAVLVVNGFISLRFKLGLHTQLVVASIRMVVQLSLLGYILVPIFTYDKWWLVLLYGMFMLLIASVEAVQRPSYTFQGVFANTVLAMAASSGVLLSYMVLVVLGLRPVWEAQYIIPLLGMLLGNATSAVSVGLSTVLEDLASNRAVIEHLLAMGANRFEATDEVVRRALKVSMTPLLNQMSVMGIVSIPGMMTGQILAGGNPTQAARYQMVIIFIVVAATCLASVTSIYLAVLHVVDSTHTFRVDRLLKKQVHPAGVAAKWAEWAAAARRHSAAVRHKGAMLGSCLATACCCCLCPQPAPRHRRARSIGGVHGDGSSSVALLSGGDVSDSPWDILPAGPARQVASPFIPSSRHRLRWPRIATAAAGGWFWPSKRGASGSGAATHLDHPFSTDSATSSLLGVAVADGLTEGPGSGSGGGGGGGGGVTSPLSVRSTGLAGGSSVAPKLLWDERIRDPEADGSSGVYDTEEGGVGGAATVVVESGQGGAGDQTQQPSLDSRPGFGPLAGATGQAHRSWAGPSVTHGSSILGSSISAVAAVGGWLGSQASVGWSAAWSSLGKWRSSGSTAEAVAAGPAGPASGPVPEPKGVTLNKDAGV